MPCVGVAMRSSIESEIEDAFLRVPMHLGVQVGKLCVDGEVPLAFVAGVVGSTPVTVYRWVKGLSLPNSQLPLRKLKRMAYTLREATRQGIIPMEKFDMSALLPLWKQSKTEIQ